MLESDTALDRYTDDLADMRQQVVDAEATLSGAAKVVAKISDMQKFIEETKDDSAKLRKVASDLDLVVNLISKFGPLKSIANPLKSLSEEIEDRADQLDKQVGTVTDVVVPFQTTVKVMGAAIKTAQFALWDARGDIDAVEQSLSEATETLANTADMLPAELQATYDAVLGDGGTVDQIAADIDGVAATIARVNTGATDVINGLNPLDGFVEAMNTAADQIAAVLDPLTDLIGPLSAVGDVLGDFEWVLDAADWAFDTFVSPVLDPILESLGVQDLVDRLAAPLNDLVPDIDLLPDFLTADFDLAGKLQAVFGPPEATTPGVFTDALSAADSLAPLLQLGDTGIIGELFRDGAGTDDFLMGINTALINESVLNGGAGRDILGAGGGDDTLNGGADRDILLAGAGDDVLDGGADIDAVVFNGYFGGFDFVAEDSEETGSGTISVSKLSFQDRGEGGDTGFGAEVTYDVEYFVFRDVSWTYDQLARAIRVDYDTNPTRTISGDQSGDPTDDILLGDTLDDQLNGLKGNDFLMGYEGYDLVRGGAGTDTYSYSGEFAVPDVGAIDGATVVLDLGFGAGLLSQRDDDLRGIENVVGSNSNDLIIGNGTANELNGGGLSDTLVGGGGKDRLIGSDGADILIGGRGADYVSGGTALDLYIAGRGADTYAADPTDAAGFQDFDLLYYGATYSAFLEVQVGPVYRGNLAAYDPDLAEDFPEAIEADLSTGKVRKLDASGAASFGTDTLINISNLLATDGNDVLRAGASFAILDGADGDDLLEGLLPTAQSDLLLVDVEGESTATRQGSALVGGAGNDTLTSYTGDDLLVGGFGDDRIMIKTDTGPDAQADRFDGIGGIFGGLDTRDSSLLTLIEDFADLGDIADSGWDVLDLSQSDQAWVLRLDEGSATSYAKALPSSTNSGDLINQMVLDGIEEVVLGDTGGEVWAEAGAALRVQGGAGDDVLRGASGATLGIELNGGAGNDTITGGSGIDVLRGGDGDDLISDLAALHSAVETVEAGAGDDIFRAGANGAYDIDGGSGRDLVDFSLQSGAVILNLKSGGGSLSGRDVTLTGVEAVIGSTSADTLNGSVDGDLLAGSDGDDLLQGKEGDDALFGGRGDDTLFGGGGDDRLHGGLGNDVLNGRGGFDMVDLSATSFGEAASLSETYVEDFAGNWAVDLGAGTAVLSGTDAAANFTLLNIEAARGGDLADTITGNDGKNLISGEGGDDVIDGAGGDDVLSGGDGDDMIIGGTGDDQISGNGGENTIYGGAGKDIIIGAQIDDTVEMVYFNRPEENIRTGRLELPDADVMPMDALTIEMMIKADPLDEIGQPSATLVSYAVPGNDNEFLVIAENNAGLSNQITIAVDRVYFKTGYQVDGTLFDGTEHRFAVTMDAATGSLGLFVDGEEVWSITGDSTVRAIETGGHLVFGGEQDGYNTGYNPDQAFIGAMGDIRLYDTALDADDIANSPFGAITDASTPGLVANWQASPDTIYTMADTQGGSAVTLEGGSRQGQSSTRGDEVYGEDGADEIHGGAGGDYLDGGNHADLIFGDDGDDDLVGGNGKDTLDGGAGRDLLDGGANGDVIFGGDGNDEIYGGAGNDTITGGQGVEFIFGDIGRDTFVYTDASESTATSQDYIHDFIAGTDIIDLSAMDADTTTAGDDAFVFVGYDGFSGVAGELALTPDSGLAILEGDQDGDGVADFGVYLGTLSAWTADDFIL